MGDDTLFGGDGYDILTGGEGADVFERSYQTNGLTPHKTNGCCQTNEPKHRWCQTNQLKHQKPWERGFYEAIRERHSLRAESRLSLNVLRFESDLCELNRL